MGSLREGLRETLTTRESVVVQCSAAAHHCGMASQRSPLGARTSSQGPGRGGRGSITAEGRENQPNRPDTPAGALPARRKSFGVPPVQPPVMMVSQGVQTQLQRQPCAWEQVLCATVVIQSAARGWLARRHAERLRREPRTVASSRGSGKTGKSKRRATVTFLTSPMSSSSGTDASSSTPGKQRWSSKLLSSLSRRRSSTSSTNNTTPSKTSASKRRSTFATTTSSSSPAVADAADNPIAAAATSATAASNGHASPSTLPMLPTASRARPRRGPSRRAPSRKAGAADALQRERAEQLAQQAEQTPHAASPNRDTAVLAGTTPAYMLARAVTTQGQIGQHLLRSRAAKRHTWHASAGELAQLRCSLPPEPLAGDSGMGMPSTPLPLPPQHDENDLDEDEPQPMLRIGLLSALPDTPVRCKSPRETVPSLNASPVLHDASAGTDQSPDDCGAGVSAAWTDGFADPGDTVLYPPPPMLLSD